MKFFKLTLIFILLSPLTAFSKGSPSLLKNINLLSEDYHFLNPAHGFAWIEGGILENYSEIYDAKEDQDEKNLVFVINMFFQRINEFTPSNKVEYLTPERIGGFLGELVNLKDSIPKKNKKEELKTELFSSYFSGENHREKTNINRAINKTIGLNADARMYFVYLGLLWYKIKNKEDILSYYKGLYTVLGNSAFKEGVSECSFLTEESSCASNTKCTWWGGENIWSCGA
jgi:hypothetical protein